MDELKLIAGKLGITCVDRVVESLNSNQVLLVYQRKDEGKRGRVTVFIQIAEKLSNKMHTKSINSDSLLLCR